MLTQTQPLVDISYRHGKKSCFIKKLSFPKNSSREIPRRCDDGDDNKADISLYECDQAPDVGVTWALTSDTGVTGPSQHQPPAAIKVSPLTSLLLARPV